MKNIQNKNLTTKSRQPKSNFWQSLQQFLLEANLKETEIDSDDVYAGVRDKSVGRREVIL